MKKTILTALIMALAFSPMAFAGHGGGHGGGRCEKGGCGSHGEKKMSCCPIMNKLLMQAHTALEHRTQLGLTPDQVSAIREIKITAKKENVRMAAEMQIAEIDIKSKLHADTLDVEGLNAMIDQMAAGMPEKGKQVVAWYAKFRETLKPEQWAKLQELS